MTIKNAKLVPMINIVLMILGLLCFGVVIIAAIKLIFMYLVWKLPQDPPGVLISQVVSMALLFLMGWSISLVIIRILKSVIYPFILRVLGLFVSFGMVGIYWFGVFKTYNERPMGLEKYALVLFAGYLVLVAFYLLTEKADLHIMIFPLGFALGVHIFSLVLHYVIYKPNDLQFFYIDIGLIAILSMIIAMMVRLGLYLPLKQTINAVLIANTPKSLPGLRSKLLS
jgi:hypothetical protein